MTKDTTEAKTFSLTGVETQLLITTQDNLQAIMSNQIAMIAVQRLNYQVTPNTRFTFGKGMESVTISEDVPAEDTGVVGE